MGDVLAMIELKLICGIKLNMRRSELVDKEICKILKQAECLHTVINLDLSESCYSGAGLGVLNLSL